MQELPPNDEQESRAFRRRRGRSGAQLILLACLGGFALGLAQSPLFWITEVRVDAPDPPLAEAASRVIQVPAQASTLFYPVSAVERQAQQLPQILSVQVTRDLPHRLVVKVTRRLPTVAMQTEAGVLLVAEDGVITNLVPPGQKAPPLPLLIGLAPTSAQPGQRLAPEAASLVAEVGRAAAAHGLGAGLRLDFARPFDVRLTIEGVEGLLGGSDNLERKLSLFAQVWRELQKQGAHPAYIDVRLMDRPVWRPREEAGGPAATGSKAGW